MFHPPRIKICCIQSEAEARLAADAGAHAVGLVSDEMPSGPGTIAIERIAAIARALRDRPALETFLLTCRTRADAIVELVRASECTTVQLCDAVDDGAHAALRSALPGVRIVQVIHVEDELALDEAFQAQDHVDALLLDSGQPKAAQRTARVRELGGTGRAHDWTISHRIVGMARVPVWLAGGLMPENLATAIRNVNPFGLDVCSGVRTDGKLDADKLNAFVNAARQTASG